VGGLNLFRKKWDEGRQLQGVSCKNALSDQGHINLNGSATCFRSAIFTPADPEFLDSIEVGVRDLVLFLVEKLNCITYSSCEGHPPTEHAPMRQRHVGILPRDEEEYARLLHQLRRAAEAAHTTWDREAIRIDIKEDVITTEGPNVPCIDVVFTAVASDWSAYSRTLQPIHREFLAHLMSFDHQIR
jgi:uncharacterized protein